MANNGDDDDSFDFGLDDHDGDDDGIFSDPQALIALERAEREARLRLALGTGAGAGAGIGVGGDADADADANANANANGDINGRSRSFTPNPSLNSNLNHYPNHHQNTNPNLNLNLNGASLKDGLGTVTTTTPGTQQRYHHQIARPASTSTTPYNHSAGSSSTRGRFGSGDGSSARNPAAWARAGPGAGAGAGAETYNTTPTPTTMSTSSGLAVGGPRSKSAMGTGMGMGMGMGPRPHLASVTGSGLMSTYQQPQLQHRHPNSRQTTNQNKNQNPHQNNNQVSNYSSRSPYPPHPLPNNHHSNRATRSIEPSQTSHHRLPPHPQQDASLHAAREHTSHHGSEADADYPDLDISVNDAGGYEVNPRASNSMFCAGQKTADVNADDTDTEFEIRDSRMDDAGRSVLGDALPHGAGAGAQPPQGRAGGGVSGGVRKAIEAEFKMGFIPTVREGSQQISNNHNNSNGSNTTSRSFGGVSGGVGGTLGGLGVRRGLGRSASMGPSQFQPQRQLVLQQQQRSHHPQRTSYVPVNVDGSQTSISESPSVQPPVAAAGTTDQVPMSGSQTPSSISSSQRGAFKRTLSASIREKILAEMSGASVVANGAGGSSGGTGSTKHHQRKTSLPAVMEEQKQQPPDRARFVKPNNDVGVDVDVENHVRRAPVDLMNPNDRVQNQNDKMREEEAVRKAEAMEKAMEVMRNQLEQINASKQAAELEVQKYKNEFYTAKGAAETVRRNQKMQEATHAELSATYKKRLEELQEKMLVEKASYKREVDKLETVNQFKVHELMTARRPGYISTQQRRSGDRTPSRMMTRSAVDPSIRTPSKNVRAQRVMLGEPPTAAAEFSTPLMNAGRRGGGRLVPQSALKGFQNSFSAPDSGPSPKRSRRGENPEWGILSSSPAQLLGDRDHDLEEGGAGDDDMAGIGMDMLSVGEQEEEDQEEDDEDDENELEEERQRSLLLHLLFSHCYPLPNLVANESTLYLLLQTEIPPDARDTSSSTSHNGYLAPGWTRNCQALLNLSSELELPLKMVMGNMAKILRRMLRVLTMQRLAIPALALLDLLVTLQSRIPFFRVGDNLDDSDDQERLLVEIVDAFRDHEQAMTTTNKPMEMMVWKEIGVAVSEFAGCLLSHEPEYGIVLPGLFITDPSGLNQLLKPAQHPDIVLAAVEFVEDACRWDMYESLTRPAAQPSTPSTTEVDVSRIPLFESLCVLLCDRPIGMSQDAHTLLSLRILHIFASLTIMRDTSIVIMSANHHLMPTLIRCISDGVDVIWGLPGKKQKKTMEGSLSILISALSMLHHLVFPPSPSDGNISPPPGLDLANRLQMASTQKEFEAYKLFDLFISAVGRVAWAEIEIEGGMKGVEMKALAEMAQDLLEVVAGGPEGDAIYELYVADDVADDDDGYADPAAGVDAVALAEAETQQTLEEDEEGSDEVQIVYPVDD